MPKSQYPFVFVASLALIALIAVSCSPQSQSDDISLLAQENLVAWCIVPFDAQNRGPEERVAMLKRLGFTQYAYDWRQRHLPEFASELKIAEQAGIPITKVWIWIDASNDQVGKLGTSNQAIFDAVAEHGQAVEFWLGFHENYFAKLTDDAKLEKASQMVAYLAELAKASESVVALYNHGGWFGEPSNQIAIIEKIGSPHVRIVYNFHHAHHEIDSFPENLEAMLPHLSTVTLNGMTPEGPKILPIGQGTREASMIAILVNSGFQGDIAILGHVEDEDVEEVLQTNLSGLRSIRENLTR